MRAVAVADVRRWRARRWCLSFPAPDVEAAVAANLPLYASRAAYLSLFARLDRFEPKDLHALVFDRGALVATIAWGVGEVLVPPEMLAALGATHEFAWRAGARRSRLDRQLNAQVDRRRAGVLEALGDGPLPEASLVPRVEAGAQAGDWPAWWVLRRLVARGDLVMTPAVRSLASDEWLFALGPQGAPTAWPDGYGFLAQVALAYFRAAGPATRDDFARWAGVSKAAARHTLEDLAGEIEEVDIEGGRRAHFMLEDDAASLRGRPIASSDRAALLPARDPAMAATALGYAALADDRAAARLPLVPRRSKKGLGRVAQPALAGGLVVGSWDVDTKRQRVLVEFVRELGDGPREAVEREAQRVEAFLFGELARLPHARDSPARPLPALYRSPPE